MYTTPYIHAEQFRESSSTAQYSNMFIFLTARLFVDSGGHTTVILSHPVWLWAAWMDVGQTSIE